MTARWMPGRRTTARRTTARWTRAPRPVRALALAATLSPLLAAPLAAQPRPIGSYAPDQTGTGAGPGSTITAPNTNGLGVTKPPGGADPAVRGDPDQITRTERRENRMMDGICDGCN